MKSLFIIFGLFLIVSPAFGQDTYEEWLRKQQEELQAFRDERDQAFTAFLKKSWKEVEVEDAEEVYETPKPDVLPEAPPPVIEETSDVPEESVDTGVEEVETPVVVLPPPPVVEEAPPAEPAPEPISSASTSQMTLDFYQSSLDVRYARDLKVTIGRQLDKETIGTFWEDISKAAWEDVLAQALHHKQTMRLNDWGYGVYLDQMAQKLYPRSANTQTLFVWFMLTKSGYDARVGYNDRSVHLMLPSAKQIYGLPYFTIDEKWYYVISFRGAPERTGSLFTYEGSYPDASAVLDLDIDAPMVLAERLIRRPLKFDYQGENYEIPVIINKNTIDLLEWYPQSDISVYLNGAVASKTQISLLDGLRPLIEGKSELDAVNLILRFVQISLEYKTDDDQFGREKFLFPEETLFYPYADCEDRSILFAFLVHHLTGLPVVALEYPGHVAAAVSFSQPVEGTNFRFENKVWTITDPTYINASAGMAMPFYQGKAPKVHKVSLN